METYVKYMCPCGLSIGTFLLKEPLTCPKCHQNIMKYKVMKDGNDNGEWDDIKLEDCNNT
jgi:hypothetical protein